MARTGAGAPCGKVLRTVCSSGSLGINGEETACPSGSKISLAGQKMGHQCCGFVGDQEGMSLALATSVVFDQRANVGSEPFRLVWGEGLVDCLSQGERERVGC